MSVKQGKLNSFCFCCLQERACESRARLQAARAKHMHGFLTALRTLGSFGFSGVATLTLPHGVPSAGASTRITSMTPTQDDVKRQVTWFIWITFLCVLLKARCVDVFDAEWLFSIIIIMIEICKVPTPWLKALNKRNMRNVYRDRSLFSSF